VDGIGRQGHEISHFHHYGLHGVCIVPGIFRFEFDLPLS
jgi:hypothetical protein